MPIIKPLTEELQKSDKISASNRIVRIFKQLYGRPDNKTNQQPEASTSPTSSNANTITSNTAVNANTIINFNPSSNRSLDNEITIGYLEVLNDRKDDESLEPLETAHDNLITIDVNSRKCNAFNNQIVSYVDIVRLAFDKTYTVIKTDNYTAEPNYRVYPMDNIDFTVLYTRGYHNTSGILIRKQSIKLVNGMHFSVALTNNA